MERIVTDNGYRLMGKRGTVDVSLPSSGTALLEFHGMAGADFALELQEYLSSTFGEQTFQLFVDASDLQSYETQFRKSWVNWLKHRKQQVTSVHVLFKSKLVEMAIGLASAVLGDTLESYSQATRFRAKLDEVIAKDAALNALGSRPRTSTVDPQGSDPDLDPNRRLH